MCYKQPMQAQKSGSSTSGDGAVKVTVTELKHYGIVLFEWE